MRTEVREYISPSGRRAIDTITYGRATYIVSGREVVADVYTARDWGKTGVTRIYERFPDITPEENERRINELIKIGSRIHARHIMQET